MIVVDSTRTLYFSPDDDTESAYVNYLQTKMSKIYIADYSFNLEPIVTLLIQKHSQGVDVRLVLDKSQSSQKYEEPEVAQLITAGIPVTIGTSSYRKIMHDKFTVADSTCQYGSWNYTGVASKEDNFFFTDTNPDVATYFLTAWRGMHDWIAQNEPEGVHNE